MIPVLEIHLEYACCDEGITALRVPHHIAQKCSLGDQSCDVIGNLLCKKNGMLFNMTTVMKSDRYVNLILSFT